MEQLLQAFIPLVISLTVSILVSSAAGSVPAVAACGASALAGISAAITLICMCVLYQRDGQTGVPRPKGFSKKTALPLFCAAAFVCGAVASVLAGRIMEAAGLYQRLSNETQEQLYSAALWIQLAGPGLLVPLAEEMTYRVVFYDRLRRILPRTAAVLVVSLLFAAGHGNWIQALYAFPMSLLLCACYEISGSVLGPAAMHMGANLISILWMAR